MNRSRTINNAKLCVCCAESVKSSDTILIRGKQVKMLLEECFTVQLPIKETSMEKICLECYNFVKKHKVLKLRIQEYEKAMKQVEPVKEEEPSSMEYSDGSSVHSEDTLEPFVKVEDENIGWIDILRAEQMLNSTDLSTKNTHKTPDSMASKSGKCNICGKVYRRLADHQKYAHIDVSDRKTKTQHSIGRDNNTSSDDEVRKDTKRPLTYQSSGHKPGECDVCGKNYQRLADHKKYAHNIINGQVTTEPFSCKLCPDRIFPLYRDWYRHKKQAKHVLSLYDPLDEPESVAAKHDSTQIAYIPCKWCGNLYKTKSSLMVHEERCVTDLCTYETPDGATYKCVICGADDDDREYMMMHVKSHEVIEFTCQFERDDEDCGEKLNNFSDYIKHLEVCHPSEKTLTCSDPECDSTFFLRAELTKHLRQKHRILDSTNATCQICGIQVRRINEHMKYAHEISRSKKEYKCKLCPNSKFKTYALLKRHRSATHWSKRVCTFCGISVRDANLSNHMKRHEKNKRQFACHLCGKRFNVKSDRHRHVMRSHDEPVKCELCDENFKPYLLKRHVMMNHSTAPKLRCSFCHKVFFNEDTWREHEGKHELNLLVSYTCDRCDLTFATKSKFVRHKGTKSCMNKELLDL